MKMPLGIMRISLGIMSMSLEIMGRPLGILGMPLGIMVMSLAQRETGLSSGMRREAVDNPAFLPVEERLPRTFSDIPKP